MQRELKDVPIWSELAARAIFGKDVTYDKSTSEICFPSGRRMPWDSYSDDGDSRMLEVQLYMNVRHLSFLVPATHTIEIGMGNEWFLSVKAGKDPASTLRKMVLMLAAMIGRHEIEGS